MLGDAMSILESTTEVIACRAASLLLPTFSPSSVNSSIPSWSSVILISGMLTQLAAATAANGTRRPANAGPRAAKRFRVRAVKTAPVVAAT